MGPLLFHTLRLFSGTRILVNYDKVPYVNNETFVFASVSSNLSRFALILHLLYTYQILEFMEQEDIPEDEGKKSLT